MNVTLDQAHKRFGHASDERLKHLTSAAEGIKLNDKERDFVTVALKENLVDYSFLKRDNQSRREDSR